MSLVANRNHQGRFPTVGRSMGGMFILRIASQLVTLATIIILTRTLGPDEFGRYAFLFGFLTLFTLFNVNGLNDILVRDIASRPEQRDIIYRNGLALKLIAGTIAFTLACSVVLLFNISTLPKWICCVAALTLFVSFSMGSARTVWDIPYQVDFQMTSASAINLTGRLLFLTLLALWILKYHTAEAFCYTGLQGVSIWGGVTTVIILQIFSELSATGVQGIVNVRNRYTMLPDWNGAVFKYLLREVWPLALAGGLVMIYAQINVVMIKYFLSNSDVGLFAAPKRMVDALTIIPTVFITSALPILSRTFRESRKKFLELVSLSYRVMFLVSFLIVTVVLFYSTTIMRLLSGETFAASGPVLGILIWVSVLSFSGTVFNGVLIASGQQKLLMIIYAAQAIVCVVLNVLVIPKFGIIGSAAVTLTVYAMMFPIALAFKDIRYAGSLWLRAIPVPMLCALAAGFSARLLGLSLLPAVAFGPAAFISLVLLTRCVDRADLILVRDILARRAV